MGKRKAKAGNKGAGVLLVCTLAVLAATLSIVVIRLRTPVVFNYAELIPLGVFLAGVASSLIWLRLLSWRGDIGLVGGVFLLCGLGVVVQMRMGGFAQGLARPLPLLVLPLGLVAFLAGVTAAHRGRGKWLAHCGWLAYLLAVLVVGAMLVLGKGFRGGTYMPGYTNPSEIVKLLLVIFLAAFFSKNEKDFTETQVGIPVPALDALLVILFLWAIPAGIIFLLKDLGMLLLLNATLIIMLFAIARSTGYLALGVAGVTLAGFGLRVVSENVANRIDVWMNPFVDPVGKGWQNLQALCAMYSGGMWGSGLGAGVPQSVPIVTSDFVYAALAEEAGFVGCILLVVVYMAVFSRGFRVAGAARTPFERLLGVGITGSLAVQTLINIAGVAKALPMTGVTLPFISHGGSSFVTSMLAAGLLVGLSDNQKS